VLWAVGFFYPGSFTSAGYGHYRLNLLGPLITYQDWSRLAPDLPHSDYDYEGLSFLGIGVFGALILALVSGSIRDIGHLVRRRWLLLTLFCLGCSIFALSNVIGIGDRETAPIPYGPVETLGAIFRSSGRFVWPMLYLVIIGMIVVSVRRLPKPVAGIALAVLLAVQVYDSSSGWSYFQKTMPVPSATWPTPLTSPFWDRVVDAGYTQLRGIPPISRNAGLPRHPDWRWLEYFAATHGIALDTVYLGRIDDSAAQASEAAQGPRVARRARVVGRETAREHLRPGSPQRKRIASREADAVARHGLRRGHGGDHLLAPHREDLGGRVLPLRAVRDDFRGCEERLGGAKPEALPRDEGIVARGDAGASFGHA